MKNYLYDGYLSKFIYKEIGAKLNISFDEYLNRPRYQIEAIDRIVDKIAEQKAKANASVIDELDQVKKNLNS